MLDTHLDLLDRDIPVNNLFVSKTSLRRLQDMSSRRFEDVFSVTIFHLPRRLQDVLEDKKLLHLRRVEDQQLFAGYRFLEEPVFFLLGLK